SAPSRLRTAFESDDESQVMVFRERTPSFYRESPTRTFGYPNMEKLGGCSQEWAVGAVQRVLLRLKRSLESVPWQGNFGPQRQRGYPSWGMRRESSAQRPAG